MDDRDQPDSNVVRLRRRGDPGEEERQRLASTIFAEEDEVGTFSRGNLLPPKQNGDRDEEPPAAPDPFFDELQRERSASSAEAAFLASESTEAYFDQIGSQTPVEMSEGIPAPAARRPMPGSAHLPGDIAKPSRRRQLRSAGKARPENGARVLSSLVALGPRVARLVRELARLPHRLRARTVQLWSARLRAAVAIALLLVTGTVVATVVVTRASGGASVKRSAAHGVNRGRLTLASRGHAALTHLPVQARVNDATSHAKRAVRHRAPPHSNRAAAPAHTATAVASRPTSTAASSGSAPQPVTQPVTQSQPSGGGSSTAEQSSVSSNSPSFGANGILGPGHSPNG